MQDTIRMYLTLRRPAEGSAFRDLLAEIARLGPRELAAFLFGSDHGLVAIEPVTAPSMKLQIRGIEIPPAPARLDEIVLIVRALPSARRDLQARVLTQHPELDPVLVVDQVVGLANYWCPSPAHVSFGNRALARQFINAGALPKVGHVNVILVDEGLDAIALGQNYGGGWEIFDPAQPAASIEPGTTVGGHGAMVSRNVIDLAPQVRLFDMPLVPRTRPPLLQWLSTAQAAFATMRADIAWLIENFPAQFGQPWIVSNSWAVFGRDEDTTPPFYADDPAHPMNLQVGKMVAAGRDTIFAASNCGTFCPDLRCGRTDRGPGRSIFGANSHARVITVGAIRTDGDWLGYSSEGPGLLTPIKPDLCAPASFCEDHDAAMNNGGTSAACAVVAGVVAAIRTLHDQTQLPPDQLHLALVASARFLVGQAGFSPRLGHGVIDASRLLGMI